MNSGTLQSTATTLLRREYTPVFVPLGSKAPNAHGWQNTKPTIESIARQFGRPSNIGVRMGDLHSDGTTLIGIDIDIEEHSLVVCVERALGEKVPCKRGKKGYTYIFRLDREYESHKIYWVRDGKPKVAAIDVLAKGSQTILPPSIHPQTGQPYQWVSGTPLDQIDYRALPVFPPTAIDEIRGFCKSADDPIFALNEMEWLGEGGGGNTHDVCVPAVASMVTRSWPDEDIHGRITRAKREACERAGTPYDWGKSAKVIQGWIDSARAKYPRAEGKSKKISHGSLADAFLAEVRPDIRYDWDKKSWYSFDTVQWLPNQDPSVRYTIERYLPVELRNRATIEGVLRSLQDRPELRVTAAAWDTHPTLLNTPAGTVDLKTGVMCLARASDLITRCTTAAPDDSGPPLLWIEKLAEWFGDEPVELDYVSTLLGYVCTGETREHCLPLWIGPGGDGKSVVTGLIASLLGSYAGVATDSVFQDTRYSQHSEELAMLNGLRLVRVSEMSGHWREDRIKQITGGESITSSFKNAHLFTYTPSFKLIVTANEPPRLRSVGKDMARRFHVLKFARGVREVDTHLPEKLREEGGKILASLIAGAVKYYEVGLTRSPGVVQATSEYFHDNDSTQQWIDACADVGPDYRVSQATAYESYRTFMSEDQGFNHIPTRMDFQNRLVAKGIIKKNAVVTKGYAPVPALIGIRLKQDVHGNDGPDY